MSDDLLARMNDHDIVRAKTGIDYKPDVALWYGVDDDDRAVAKAQAKATLAAMRDRVATRKAELEHAIETAKAGYTPDLVQLALGAFNETVLLLEIMDAALLAHAEEVAYERPTP